MILDTLHQEYIGRLRSYLQSAQKLLQVKGRVLKLVWQCLTQNLALYASLLFSTNYQRLA